MARRRRRGGGGSNAKTLLAAVILAVALGSLAGLAGFIWHLNVEKSRFDPETFCPHDGSDWHTAILIDASDPLSSTQVKRVLEMLGDLRRDLRLHEWVGLYVLDENDYALPQPEFALCSPGSEEQANPLYENPERIRRTFEEEFQQPLVLAVEELGTEGQPEQSTSPILEMIRAVATDRSFRFSGTRRLVIVSDMLQNMPEYSHYRGTADFGQFSGLEYAKPFLGMSLLDVDVEIIYLKRAQTARLQTRGHIRFWEEYFDSLDASLNRVEPVL